MRVPFVVMALVAAPFIASNAQGGNRSSRNDNVQQQGQHNDGEKCDKVKKDKDKDNRGRNERGQKGRDDSTCAATKPPAPAPVPVGQAEVHGTVFNDTDGDGVMGMFEYGLSGWTVTLSGPVTTSVVSDASGTYAFTQLPVGLYTVCQVPLAGWSQTGPKTAVGTACPGGTGWALDVPATMPALWYGSIDFGNKGIAQ